MGEKTGPERNGTPLAEADGSPPGWPDIDLARCDGCGRCVEACPAQALLLVDGRVQLKAGAQCSFCAECEAICPTGAIRCPYEVTFG